VRDGRSLRAANAEIVIEGFLQIDPAKYLPEGPFAEFTGYLAAIRHRSRPFRVTPSPIAQSDPARHHRGRAAGSYSEKHRHVLNHAGRHRVERGSIARRAGITDVWCNRCRPAFTF